jgi:hypothetical protein
MQDVPVEWVELLKNRSCDDRLSFVVAGILSSEPGVEVAQADCQVVAFTFEDDEDVRQLWDIAVATAMELFPWLKEGDAHESDWSMNLFTRSGVWEFPKEP